MSFERFRRTYTGDIRNFPRKDQLEEDLRSGEIFSSERRREDLMRRMGDVRKVYIIGSWGRGTAIPFISDLDILYLAEANIGLALGLDTRKYVIFPNTDVFSRSTLEQIEDTMKDNFQGTENALAYNLTERKNVRPKTKGFFGEVEGI